MDEFKFSIADKVSFKYKYILAIEEYIPELWGLSSAAFRYQDNALSSSPFFLYMDPILEGIEGTKDTLMYFPDFFSE